MLERTLAVFNNLPDNWKDIAWMYLEAFEDIPRDLAEKALKHVRLNNKWFPKPAELREPIKADLAKRKSILSKISTMEMGLKHFGERT